MKNYLAVFIVLLLFGAGVYYYLNKENSSVNNGVNSNMTNTKEANAKKQWSSAPVMALNADKNYSAVLETSKGNITIGFFPKETPVTVNNFIFLARQGFYNDTKFHRIIKGFMIQGGDPLGNGTGGPGYKFSDEPVTRDYERGVVAMANSGPNTNGSQFFIMHQNYDLPKNYVIFGKVTDGFDVLDEIASVAVKANNSGELSVPEEDIIVKAVNITEK